MLYAYNTTSTAYTAGQQLSFPTTGTQTGCTAVKTTSNTISLNKPGYYMVHFNSDAATATDAGNISAILQVNGTAYPAAEATAYSSATTDIQNLGFTTIIQVQPNCMCNTSNVPVTLTVVNGTTAATFTNAAITVTKIA